MITKLKFTHESGPCTATFNSKGQIQGCTNDKTGNAVNLTTHERTALAATLAAKPKRKAKAPAKRKAKAKAK